ncbi:cold-shock protein [Acinetobacter sp. YH12120]|uniref:cold-shock protein n=1 Tax=Acinetobacter sp. YH12120 TaxID=2601107 RepID=UPI0015D133E4|nr:cold shock domain-containing protein [Acinetobacter sp. YH12120]
MKSEQYQGKIIQYNAEKGYGFIAAPEGEVFFHISDFPAAEGEPKRNDRVKFNVVQNGDRYKAINIEPVEDKSKKAKKAKAVAANTSITSALLSNLKR